MIGIGLSLLDLPLRWKAFGVGLIFPGAGELYRGNVWLFALVLALIPVAIYRMWIIADHLSLPALYLGSAVITALLSGGTCWPWVTWAVPVAVVASVAVVETLRWIGFARARRVGLERNSYIAHHPATTDVISVISSGSRNGPRVVESTLDELRLQRWVLDHALQPIDEWDVYDWSEKGQRDTRSVRYQLNWLQWALAVGQFTRTPSFSGYVAEGPFPGVVATGPRICGCRRRHIRRLNRTFWRLRSSPAILKGNCRRLLLARLPQKQEPQEEKFHHGCAEAENVAVEHP